MNKQRPPTMYDVARIAGVSQKTVSRVFNNEPVVEDKTRQKVIDAAAKLQFVPNVAARRLATQKALVIGLVFESEIDIASLAGGGGFFAEVAFAALMTCHREGYGLMLQSCALDDPTDHKALVQLGASGSVDGLILTPPLAQCRSLVELLRSQQVTFIECFSSFGQDKGIPCVTAGDRKGSRDLTRLVLSRGHRKIAYIKGIATHQSSEERFQGFRDAHEEAGVEIDPQLVKQGDYSFDSGIECGKELLDMSPRPTAILAFNDDIASGVLAAAHQMGISIPSELSVAGFDDSGIAKQLWPPLTTVRQPIHDIVTLGTDLLIRLLRGEALESPSVELPARIIERGTVAPPSGVD